jgi:dCMP deaminase
MSDHSANERLAWDDLWLGMADAISKRATCDRGRSGCVIVRDNRLLTAGYVGSPPNLPHCDEVGHDLRKTIELNGTISEHCVRTIHAEQNAILQAAIVGVSIQGATLYCRMTPCRTCAMFIIACGIKKVVCERKYRAGTESEEMFHLAGINLVYKYNEVQKYAGEK